MVPVAGNLPCRDPYTPEERTDEAPPSAGLVGSVVVDELLVAVVDSSVGYSYVPKQKVFFHLTSLLLVMVP